MSVFVLDWSWKCARDCKASYRRLSQSSRSWLVQQFNYAGLAFTSGEIRVEARR